MGDLVKRLRAAPLNQTLSWSDGETITIQTSGICHDAADRIEQLESDLWKSKDRAEHLWQTLMAVHNVTEGKKQDLSGFMWPQFVTTVEELKAQADYFQQQYVRKCEHEFEVRQQNQKLEEALQEINKRLNDSDSWLAQSIDCRNIAEAALGEKR